MPLVLLSNADSLIQLSQSAQGNSLRDAIIYAEQAVISAKSEQEKAKALNLLGEHYDIGGFHTQAADRYVQAADLLDKINRPANAAISLMLAARNYSYFDEDSAIATYHRSLKKFIRGEDSSNAAKANNAIGSFYLERFEYDSAHKYFETALDISTKTNSAQSIAESFYNLGLAAIEKGSNDKALEYFAEAQKRFTEAKSNIDIGRTLNKKGEAYYNMGDNLNALQNYKKAYEIYKQSGDLTNMSLTLKNVSRIEYLNGRYKEAYNYLEEYSHLRSEEFNQIVNKRETERRLQIETDQRESFENLAESEQERNEKLTQAKRLQQLELESANKSRLFLLFVIILIALIAALIYRNYYVKKKTNTLLSQTNAKLEKVNKMLDEKNTKIEQQNRKILDSINYAEKIQNAVMANESAIKNIFPQSFIFFKPRDIVSGDFFWVTKIKNRRIAAVVDCSGHGVPGAFMSLIGYTMLNEIVNIKGISDPAHVLQELNSGISSILKQNSGSSVKDGMDLIICTIDDIEKKVYIGGARRPAFVYQKDGFQVYKGNRSTIGGFRNKDYDFKNITLNYEKDMMIWLTSDGYADQNGKRSKFGSRSFKLLLNEIANETLDKQKEILDNTLRDFQGSQEQRDDIAILGLRL